MHLTMKNDLGLREFKDVEFPKELWNQFVAESTLESKLKNIYCEPNVSGEVTPLGTKPTSAKVSDPRVLFIQVVFLLGAVFLVYKISSYIYGYFQKPKLA